MSQPETTQLLKPANVLLADDHTLVRAGIRALLEKLPGVTVVGEAADGWEVLELVRTLQPDLVLMDIAMPNLKALQATAGIRNEAKHARVIMLSMHQNEEYYWQALKA